MSLLLVSGLLDLAGLVVQPLAVRALALRVQPSVAFGAAPCPLLVIGRHAVLFPVVSVPPDACFVGALAFDVVSCRLEMLKLCI